jgi:hypothetical protein
LECQNILQKSSKGHAIASFFAVSIGLLFAKKLPIFVIRGFHFLTENHHSCFRSAQLFPFCRKFQIHIPLLWQKLFLEQENRE